HARLGLCIPLHVGQLSAVRLRLRRVDGECRCAEGNEKTRYHRGADHLRHRDVLLRVGSSPSPERPCARLLTAPCPTPYRFVKKHRSVSPSYQPLASQRRIGAGSTPTGTAHIWWRLLIAAF